MECWCNHPVIYPVQGYLLSTRTGILLIWKYVAVIRSSDVLVNLIDVLESNTSILQMVHSSWLSCTLYSQWSHLVSYLLLEKKHFTPFLIPILKERRENAPVAKSILWQQGIAHVLHRSSFQEQLSGHLLISLLVRLLQEASRSNLCRVNGQKQSAEINCDRVGIGSQTWSHRICLLVRPLGREAIARRSR